MKDLILGLGKVSNWIPVLRQFSLMV